MNIIDVTAAVGFWPTQLFSSHSLEDLEKVYAAAEIGEVWISATESILYPEPDSFDVKLFQQLPSFPRFRPVKTVNPLLANWETSLRTAAGSSPLAALKLFPCYHGFEVSAERLGPVFRVADELGLPILLPIRINDIRNQPVAMQVPDLAVQDLTDLSRAFPDTVIIAQCASIYELPLLAKGSDKLLADIAFLDGEGVIDDVIRDFPPQRLVFGSHEAFIHAQAAVLKIRHSGVSEDIKEAIASKNLGQTLAS